MVKIGTRADASVGLAVTLKTRIMVKDGRGALADLKEEN